MKIAEMIQNMIRPIPAELISKRDGADYVDITSMKDLLDERCGPGNWSAQVKSHGQVKTNYDANERPSYEMVVTVTIYGDDGPRVQDGTGTEWLSGPKPIGDFMTNAYAQGLRRACESFGMGRELWRRKVIPVQLEAVPDEGPHPLEQFAERSERSQQIEAEIREILVTVKGYDKQKADEAMGRLWSKSLAEKEAALEKLKAQGEQQPKAA